MSTERGMVGPAQRWCSGLSVSGLLAYLAVCRAAAFSRCRGGRGFVSD